jgi:hypothetical protein
MLNIIHRTVEVEAEVVVAIVVVEGGTIMVSELIIKRLSRRMRDMKNTTTRWELCQKRKRKNFGLP